MLNQAEMTCLNIPVATAETGAQSESTVHFEPCTHSQLFLKHKTRNTYAISIKNKRQFAENLLDITNKYIKKMQCLTKAVCVCPEGKWIHRGRFVSASNVCIGNCEHQKH